MTAESIEKSHFLSITKPYNLTKPNFYNIFHSQPSPEKKSQLSFN